MKMDKTMLLKLIMAATHTQYLLSEDAIIINMEIIEQLERETSKTIKAPCDDGYKCLYANEGCASGRVLEAILEELDMYNDDYNLDCVEALAQLAMYRELQDTELELLEAVTELCTISLRDDDIQETILGYVDGVYGETHPLLVPVQLFLFFLKENKKRIKTFLEDITEIMAENNYNVSDYYVKMAIKDINFLKKYLNNLER